MFDSSVSFCQMTLPERQATAIAAAAAAAGSWLRYVRAYKIVLVFYFPLLT